MTERRQQPNYSYMFTGIDMRSVFNTLNNLRVRKIEIQFQGGGDEGGVERIVVEKRDGTREELDVYCESEWFPADLTETLVAPVYNRYGSFAGDFFVHGTYTWDVDSQTVKQAGQSQEMQEMNKDQLWPTPTTTQ